MDRDPLDLVHLYEIYRDYMKHEDDLINQRSTWHLIIQGFLFATLGSLGQWQFSKELPDTLHAQRLNLVYVLPGLGFSVALLAFVSIWAANNAIDSLCKTWSEIRLKCERQHWELLPEIAGGGHKSAKKHGKVPAMLIPLCIATAWLIVGGMAISDRLHPPTIPTKSAEQSKSAVESRQ